LPFKEQQRASSHAPGNGFWAGALTIAVAGGELPVARLEDAAARVARFRAALAANGDSGDGTRGDTDGGGIGLAAARRALRISGSPGPVTDPLVIEMTPPGNMAVGAVPWGLAPWLPAGSVVQVPAGGTRADRQVAQALAGAGKRTVIAVIRDAHRDPGAQAVITGLLARRPATIVVEMGLPVWRPPARVYLATYGASRASGQAAAEMLGLTASAA